MDVKGTLAGIRGRITVDAPVEAWEMDACILDGAAERLVEEGKTEFLTAWIVDLIGRNPPKTEAT